MTLTHNYYFSYEEESKPKSNILFLKNCGTRTTANAIFNVLDNFYEENGLSYNSMFGFVSDAAPSMIGRHNGVHAKGNKSIKQYF